LKNVDEKLTVIFNWLSNPTSHATLKSLTILHNYQGVWVFNAAYADLFNVWSPLDSTGRIYGRAEELSNNKKTSVTQIFRKAHFDPVAYQQSLTGKGHYFIESCEGIALSALEKSNTTIGKLKSIFSVNPRDAIILEHFKKTVAQLPPDKYQSELEKFLKHNGDLANAKIENAADENTGGNAPGFMSKHPRLKKYSDYIADHISNNKTFYAAGMMMAVLSAGLYAHALITAKVSEEVKTASVTLDDAIKIVMLDKVISVNDIKSLNTISKDALANIGKSVPPAEQKVTDPFHLGEMDGMLKAYKDYYNATQPADMEKIKLPPKHEDFFIHWLATIDKEKLDSKSQLTYEIMLGDMEQQKKNGTLDFYDLTKAYDFFKEKTQELQNLPPPVEPAPTNPQIEKEKIQALINATDADLKFIDTIKMPTKLSDKAENYQTIKLLEKNYSQYIPVTPGSDNKLSFETRSNDSWNYQMAWQLGGGYVLTPIFRWLADRESMRRYTTLTGIGGYFSEMGVTWFYDAQVLGTQSDLNNSLILRLAMPLMIGGGLGLHRRVDRWNRNRERGGGFCNDMGRTSSNSSANAANAADARTRKESEIDDILNRTFERERRRGGSSTRPSSRRRSGTRRRS
jgi:hypothetical protein